MFSYTKDSNKFFVDTDSEEDESVKEEPLLIFHDKVEHEGPELDEENYRLAADKLSLYAKTATKLRADFEERAQNMDKLVLESDPFNQSINQFPPKISYEKFKRGPRGI